MCNALPSSIQWMALFELLVIVGDRFVSLSANNWDVGRMMSLPMKGFQRCIHGGR